MLNKKSIILAGLVLLGTSCASQVEAFSLGNLVPACVAKLALKAELKYYGARIALLKRSIANCDAKRNKIGEQQTESYKTERGIRDCPECSQCPQCKEMAKELDNKWWKLSAKERKAWESNDKKRDLIEKLSHKMEDARRRYAEIAFKLNKDFRGDAYVDVPERPTR